MGLRSIPKNETILANYIHTISKFNKFKSWIISVINIQKAIINMSFYIDYSLSINSRKFLSYIIFNLKAVDKMIIIYANLIIYFLIKILINNFS